MITYCGDGGGRELIKLPTGESFLSPDTDTMMNLPKGTHVVPHKETEMMLKADVPHYAKGTKGWKDKLSNIWSFIKKPFTAVKNMMDSIKIRKKEKGMARSVATGSLNYLKDKPKQFIKDIFKKKETSDDNPEYIGSGGGKPAFGWRMSSPYGYRTHPISGARRLHGGVDYAAPSGTPIPSTTNGRVSSVIRGWGGGFGNHVRVKSGIMEMLYAHMSSIAVRQGQKVKKGTILGRVGSTGASTGAHLHYETRKNGVRMNPLKVGGHETGGLILNEQLSMLGEDGQEMVIPLNKNRRSDAMKLLALTGKMLGVDDGKSKLPHQLPSMRPNAQANDKQEDSQQLKDLLEATLQQNNILMQLLQKDTTIVMNEREVGKSVANTVTKKQASKTDYNLAKLGIKGVTI